MHFREWYQPRVQDNLLPASSGFDYGCCVSNCRGARMHFVTPHSIFHVSHMCVCVCVAGPGISWHCRCVSQFDSAWNAHNRVDAPLRTKSGCKRSHNELTVRNWAANFLNRKKDDQGIFVKDEKANVWTQMPQFWLAHLTWLWYGCCCCCSHSFNSQQTHIIIYNNIGSSKFRVEIESNAQGSNSGAQINHDYKIHIVFFFLSSWGDRSLLHLTVINLANGIQSWVCTRVRNGFLGVSLSLFAPNIQLHWQRIQVLIEHRDILYFDSVVFLLATCIICEINRHWMHAQRT